MRASAVLAALSFATTTFAQAVEEGIAPDVAWPPEGCDKTAKYNFTIGYEPAPAAKRETAAEAQDSLFQINLKDGILKDGYNRVGSIVANRQFQFDGPPQAGAIYTGGFSVCSNKSLALGDSTVWYKCGSGDFFNLYDQWIGGQCDEIRIVVSYVGVPTSTSASVTPSKTSSTVAPSGSTDSAATLTATPLSSINGTMPTGVSSSFDSAPASATSSSATQAPDAPPESTGGAVPTRVPRRETFGAVVGILGAALIL